jgi:hypothetical protein
VAFLFPIEPDRVAMERLTADEHGQLEVLAGSADGATNALLQAHGFKLDVLISIVSAEFATAEPNMERKGASWSAPVT